MDAAQSNSPAVQGVTRLEARDMPEYRRKLSHVQVRYEDAEDQGGEGAEKEKVAIVSSDPISEEERAQLAYGEMPAPRSRVLLHSCCAPCSGAMVLARRPTSAPAANKLAAPTTISAEAP